MKKSYYSNVSKIIISKNKIKKAIKKAAKWIDYEYKDIDSEIVLVGILKGCIPFMGQLSTMIERDISMDFMNVSSFNGEDSAKNLPKITMDIQTDIKGKHVLLVEDIIDSGYTIKFVIDKLQQKEPASIKIITFLNKNGVRKVELEPNFSCFDIPNEFIVGFGLDYKEKCRNYEFIGVLRKELLG